MLKKDWKRSVVIDLLGVFLIALGVNRLIDAFKSDETSFLYVLAGITCLGIGWVTIWRKAIGIEGQ